MNEKTVLLYEYYLGRLKNGAKFYFAGSFLVLLYCRRGAAYCRYITPRSGQCVIDTSTVVLSRDCLFKDLGDVRANGRPKPVLWSFARRFSSLRDIDPSLF